MKWFYQLIWMLFLFSLLLTGCIPEVSNTAIVMPSMKSIPIQEPTSIQEATPVLPVKTVQVTQSNILDITFTKEDPLTDPDEILNILDRMQQNYTQWLSRSGWFLERVYTLDGSVLTATHFIDDQGNCAERFQFNERESQWSPNWMRMYDGTNVQLYDQPNPLHEAKNPPVISSPEQGKSCRLEDDVAYDLINLEAGKKIRLDDYRNGIYEDYDLNIWKVLLDGREAIVLYEDTVYAQPLPSMWKPAYGGWVPVRRDQTWLYFDPQSGGIIGKRSASHDENGMVVDGDESKIWKIDLDFDLTLPSEIDKLFKETTSAIEQYIKNQQK